MKRLFALLLVLVCTGCSASNEDYYQQAQRFLGARDYRSASNLFDQLGGYRDAADYALYAGALHALQNGERALCRHSLMQVDPFLDSARYLTWLDARDLEDAGHLEEAAALYQSLGVFFDSSERHAHLLAKIPRRDIQHARALMNAGGYQQAMALLRPYAGMDEADELLRRCEEAIARAAYDQAAALRQSGDYAEAMAAFEALGATLDSQAQALACKSALYTQAEAAYAAVTLSTCEEVMAMYAALDGYLNSTQRLASLEQRFAVGLRLLSSVDAMPYVSFGSYPTGESGASQMLLWRVMDVSGDEATLLCASVIDAAPFASATDLDVGTEASTDLPTREMLAALESLACTATPYAIAQGAEHHSDGRAWWWLADEAASGRHAIVWYSGAILAQGVDDRTATVGVRPVLYLDLNTHPLTQGSGTREDPFR